VGNAFWCSFSIMGVVILAGTDCLVDERIERFSGSSPRHRLRDGSGVRWFGGALRSTSRSLSRRSTETDQNGLFRPAKSTSGLFLPRSHLMDLLAETSHLLMKCCLGRRRKSRVRIAYSLESRLHPGESPPLSPKSIRAFLCLVHARAGYEIASG
jgi:hypothetical protein